MKSLAKRFPHAERDILAEFQNGPPQFTDALPKYQRLLWKGRAPCTDRNRGKSGGYRVIYYWDQELPNFCLLGTAFCKVDCQDLPPKEYVRLYANLKARLTELRQREQPKD